MSKAMTASELLKAYKRWHLTVFEVERNGVSWRNHHRPQSYGDMHGQVAHHTGPYGSENGMIAMLFDGRSDLSGPLCTSCVLPNGHVGMIGDGRANHAGAGAANVYSALVRDVPAPPPGPDSIDFNAVTYGDEVLNPGDDKTPYPDVQVESLIRIHAARSEHHDWKGTSTIRHAGLTKRKIDILGKSESGDELTQEFLQHEVQRALGEGPDKYSYPANKPKPKPKEPVSVWDEKVKVTKASLPGWHNDEYPAGELLGATLIYANRASRSAAAVEAEVGKLPELLRQIVREELVTYAATPLGASGPVDGAPLTRDEALQEAGVRAYLENHVPTEDAAQ